MNKYDQVYHIVTRFTDSPTLRVFFMLYLMAPSEADRQALNDRLWLDAEQFGEQGLEALRREMDTSFEHLPTMVRELHEQVTAYTQRTPAHA